MGGEPFFRDDLLQHGLAIGKQRTRRFADTGALQNRRVAARQLPTLEEGRPVDKLGQNGKVKRTQDLQSGLLRCHRLPAAIPGQRLRAGAIQGGERCFLAHGVFFTQAGLLAGNFFTVGARLVN